VIIYLSESRKKEVLKMTIVRYISTFDDVFDDLFDMPFETLSLTPTFDYDGGYRPAVESFVKGNALHLRAEIPGVDPKAVVVALDDGHLCIRGERKRKMHEVSEESCVCLEELDYGSFNRCFHVPRDIDREKIHARYELGMLDITIPLKEKLSQKTIPIEGTEGRIISVEGAGEKGEGNPEVLSKEASSTA
jgi:HSP20 family protein